MFIHLVVGDDGIETSIRGAFLVLQNATDLAKTNNEHGYATNSVESILISDASDFGIKEIKNAT